MVQAKLLFFDCDNTLVLSEDQAFGACGQLANTILSSKGISTRYTSEQLIAEFVGQTWRAMMASLQKKHSFEMTPKEIEDYIAQEAKITNDELLKNAHACEGSSEVLEKLHLDKKYKVVVVSSSSTQRIHNLLSQTGQISHLNPENIYSAVDQLEKPATKPDPAIYVYAMNKHGVKPEDCIAVEDSKAGATAAIRAKIPCIAYVGAYQTKEKKDQVGKMLLDLGCKVVMDHWNQYFDCVQQIENS